MLLFGVVNLISMQIVGVIPARYQSSRFPGKPLIDICGKSLIQRVIEQCQRAKTLSEVIVATDDSRIADHARQFCRVEMTSETHPSGTDRVAEVMEKLPDCDGAVTVQGDEPMMDPSVIAAVARALSSSPTCTALIPIKNPSDYDNTIVT